MAPPKGYVPRHKQIARNAQIVEEIKSGTAPIECAEKYDMSRQRIHQIWRSAGGENLHSRRRPRHRGLVPRPSTDGTLLSALAHTLALTQKEQRATSHKYCPEDLPWLTQLFDEVRARDERLAADQAPVGVEDL